MSNIKEVEFSAWVPWGTYCDSTTKLYGMIGRMSRNSFGLSFVWDGEQVLHEGSKRLHMERLTIHGQEAVRFEYVMELCWLIIEMGGTIIRCDARDIEDGGRWENIKRHCKKYTRTTWEAELRKSVADMPRRVKVTPK